MQSHASYCIETWGSWEPRGNKIILQRLQAISNKFFRLIFNLDRTDSVRSLLKHHNILNIFQDYDFRLKQLMHKAVNNELPNPLVHSLTISNEFFYIKNPRLQQTKKSVSFAGQNYGIHYHLIC